MPELKKMTDLEDHILKTLSASEFEVYCASPSVVREAFLSSERATYYANGVFPLPQKLPPGRNYHPTTEEKAFILNRVCLDFQLMFLTGLCSASLIFCTKPAHFPYMCPFSILMPIGNLNVPIGHLRTRHVKIT